MMAHSSAARRRGPLLVVHLAVLLFGLAGVLGKLTPLPATVIVLGRVGFAAPALGLLLGARGASLRPRRARDVPALAASGAVLALHWTAFFQSVLVSNVAVALLSYSTFPLFTTALEPILLHERPHRVDLLAAVLILPGIYLIVPSLSLGNRTTQGVAWGLLAGLTFALLSICNRWLGRSYPSAVVSFYQDAVAFVVLVPTLLFVRPAGFSPRDLVVLLVLGLLCTAIAHTLFIEGMRTLTAQAASVIAALEPVWGVVFALVLLGETPATRTLLGGILVVGATLLPSLRRRPPVPRAALGHASSLGAAGPVYPSHRGPQEAANTTDPR
jgi:drug/metabolite transporter (DMT)-like permease